MTAARLRSGYLRYVLTALAILMAAIVVIASAVIRHAQAGFGCTPWPDCYGSLSAMTAAAASSEVHVARAWHRVAASAVTVLMVVLFAMSWRRHRKLESHARFIVLALGIAVALAALGAMTAGSRLPVVTLANLLGGFALLAALTAALCVGTAAADRPSPIRIAAACMLVVVFVQAAVGGMIGAQFAAPVCADAITCGPWTWAEGLAGGAWNPWHAAVLAADRIVAPAGASMLHAMHRGLGIVVVMGLLLLAGLVRDHWPKAAWAMMAVAVAEPVLGIITAGPQASLAVVLAHHVAAAFLVAALAAIAVASHPRSAPAISSHGASTTA